MRNLLCLVCVATGAIYTTTPPRAAKREAVEKAAESARDGAAEMIKSRLATQTTRPVFEQRFASATRRRPGCVDDTSTSDVRGYGCDWYDAHPEECGRHEDEGFSAKEQCCACGGGTYPASARRLLPQDSGYSDSYSYSYSQSTLTEWTERGWCSSGLDEHPSTGETTISAEACWSACQEEHGDALVAIDWEAGDEECYCQDACECMEDVDETTHVVITRDDITELPAVCTSSSGYSYSTNAP